MAARPAVKMPIASATDEMAMENSLFSGTTCAE